VACYGFAHGGFFTVVAPTVAEHFGLSVAEEASLEERLAIIRQLADRLLPTYVAQARNFPMLLQEVVLRGSAVKVDLLLTEPYYAKRASLPDFPEVRTYEGAFTKTFRTGVFRQVLHYDIASLYPSLLLLIDRNPAGDHLGVFIELLRKLRTYRLRYKQLAREAETEEERQEAQARQTSFKIIINSFYGYLGFAGGRFADSDLAAEVTRRGREIIQSLIERFETLGHPVIEADTDGIYVVAGEDGWARPEDLLAKAADGLPEGIDLEFDGRFDGMFSYKAKNYALLDGEEVTIRGSALRSRGMEPFLRELLIDFVRHLLQPETGDFGARLARLEADLEAGRLPIESVAKAEYLSQSPEHYVRALEGEGRKPRRASLEAARLSQRTWGAGERIRYYLTTGEKARSPDWQRARPLEAPFPEKEPYDPAVYKKRLADWKKRYADFLPETEPTLL
jgi:DNA polymerase elongation subunit (family B)